MLFRSTIVSISTSRAGSTMGQAAWSEQGRNWTFGSEVPQGSFLSGDVVRAGAHMWSM